MDACGLAAAGTIRRHEALKVKAAAVQVFLDMGNDHIPLGNEDAVARHQLQVLHEGQIVQAGPGYGAAVDLDRLKDGDGCDLTRAGRVPLHSSHPGLIQVVLKLEGEAVLVMMPCTSTGSAEGSVVVFHYDTVYGIIAVLCPVFELFDAAFQLLQLERTLVCDEGADVETERLQRVQACGVQRHVVHSLQN